MIVMLPGPRLQTPGARREAQPHRPVSRVRTRWASDWAASGAGSRATSRDGPPVRSHGAASSRLLDDVLERLGGAGIVALAQPEQRLLPQLARRDRAARSPSACPPRPARPAASRRRSAAPSSRGRRTRCRARSRSAMRRAALAGPEQRLLSQSPSAGPGRARPPPATCRSRRRHSGRPRRGSSSAAPAFLTRPKSSRRYAGLSLPPLCPIQKIGLLPQAPAGRRPARRRSRSACRARGSSCCDSAKIALSWSRRSVERAEDRVERADGPLRADLREPEDRLLPHLRIRIGARGGEEDVFGAFVLALRDQEDRLAPQADRRRVAPGEHLLEDRPGLLAVHVNQRVDARRPSCRRRRPRSVVAVPAGSGGTGGRGEPDAPAPRRVPAAWARRGRATRPPTSVT